MVIDAMTGRDRMILNEVIQALSADRWVSTNTITKRVRQRYTWATVRMILSVLDELWDAEIVKPRIVDRPAGLGSVSEHVQVQEWRIDSHRPKPGTYHLFPGIEDIFKK